MADKIELIRARCEGELRKIDRIMSECRAPKPCSDCADVLTLRTFPRELLDEILND